MRKIHKHWYYLIAGIIGSVLLYVLLRKKKKKAAYLTEEAYLNDVAQGNLMILDIDQISTIDELDPKIRSLYGEVHDRLFQTEEWELKIPALKFPQEWEVQILPATKNTISQFNIKNQDKTAEILIDAYAIHSDVKGANWIIKQAGNRRVVPLQDTKQLLKELKQLLETKKKETTEQVPEHE